MNSTLKLLLVPVFAAILTVAGVGAALASEVKGTVGSGENGAQESYTDGSLVATVSEGTPATTTQSSSEESPAAARTGGRSSTRHYAQAPSSSNDPIVIIDNSSLATGDSEYAGTGGGYDPDLESTLANLGDNGNAISPQDAVAYNNGLNPLANSDLAAAGDSGVSGAKIWTAIVLGLALIGLAGYAVNALISYRRENDL